MHHLRGRRVVDRFFAVFIVDFDFESCVVSRWVTLFSTGELGNHGKEGKGAGSGGSTGLGGAS